MARFETLDQCDRTAVGLVGLQPGLLELEASDCSVTDLQHRCHQLRLCIQLQAQRNRQRLTMVERALARPFAPPGPAPTW